MEGTSLKWHTVFLLFLSNNLIRFDFIDFNAISTHLDLFDAKGISYIYIYIIDRVE